MGKFFRKVELELFFLMFKNCNHLGKWPQLGSNLRHFGLKTNARPIKLIGFIDYLVWV